MPLTRGIPYTRELYVVTLSQQVFLVLDVSDANPDNMQFLT